MDEKEFEELVSGIVDESVECMNDEETEVKLTLTAGETMMIYALLRVRALRENDKEYRQQIYNLTDKIKKAM